MSTASPDVPKRYLFTCAHCRISGDRRTAPRPVTLPGCRDTLHTHCIETFSQRLWLRPMWPCNCPRGIRQALDEYWSGIVMLFQVDETPSADGAFTCVLCGLGGEEGEGSRIPSCTHMLHVDYVLSLGYLELDGKWPCGCEMGEVDECSFCGMACKGAHPS